MKIRIFSLLALVLGGRILAGSPTPVWTGSGATREWTNSANWQLLPPQNSSDDVEFNSLSTNNLATVLGGNYSINSLRVINPTGAVSIASDANTNVLTILGGGIFMSAATRDLTFSSGLALGASQAWDIATDRTVNANGAISGGFSLTKTGQGTLILNAPNSFSGGLVVSNGSVQLRGDQQPNRLGAIQVRIETNGVVDYYDTNATGIQPVYTVNTGGVLLLGQANHQHLGVVNLNGGKILSQVRGGGKYSSEDFQMDGTISAGGSQPSFITLEYGIGLNNAVRTFDVADATGSTAEDMTLNGPAIGGLLQDGGGIIKTGAGTMMIDGGTTFNGTTTINGGTLKLGANGTLPNVSIVTVGAGSFFDVLDMPGSTFTYTNKTLLGSGTVSGAVTLVGGSTIGGGTIGSIGTLTISSVLTLPGTATNLVDIGGGQNDRIVLGGPLVVNGDTISVNATTLLTNGTYTIVTYPAAAKIGSFNTNVVVPFSRKTVMVDESPADRINLVVSGSEASIRWNSTNSTAWDVMTATNWFNTISTLPDVFFQGDAVSFADTAGVTTDVVLATTVQPLSVTVDATTNNFSIGGAGKMSGLMGLTKSGTGSLTLGGTGNDFTGAIVVSNGVLKAGSISALGATNGSTTVRSGATLDVNGQILGQEPVFVSGAGVGGNGAIINSGADQTLALQYVSLQANASMGGTGRFDIRNGTAPYLNLNGFTLTKVGTNQLSLVAAAATNVGDFVVNAGTLSLETTANVSGLGSIYVNPAATLQYYQSPTVLKTNVLNGGTIYCGSAGTIGTPIVINTNGTISTAGGSLVLTNVISGSAGFSKAGVNTLILLASNTYAGGVVIAAGALQLGNGTASGSVDGSITNNASLVFNRTDVSTLGAAISGTGALTKNGTGTVVLAGSVSQSGGLGHTAGVTVFGGPTALGGTITESAGTIIFDGNTFTSSVATNARSINVQGGATVIVTNGANLTLNGTLALGSASAQGGNYIQYGGRVVVNGADQAGNYRSFQVGEYPAETSICTIRGGSLFVTNGLFYLPWNATQGVWNLSGATAVVKQIQITTGVGLLNFESGSLVVGPGGIQRGSGSSVLNLGGGTVGAYTSWNSALDMTLTGTNGPTTFDTGANTITLTGLLSGTGGLTKVGSGALWLNRTNETYTGATVVNGGVLAVGNVLASTTTVNNGGTLAIGSPTTVSGSLSLPALTLNNGATIQVPFDAAGPRLNVTGSDLFTTTSTNAISLAGSIVTGTFPVIDYDGTIQGAGVSGLKLLPVTPRGSASLVDNVPSTTVDVVISDLGAPIRWKGNVNNQWNINTTTNWETTVAPAATTYLQNPNGDLVLFDDAAALFTVSITSNMSPTFISVSNNANDYAFSGAAIGGVNGLAKYGGGKLTLNNTNAFSGTVAVNGGSLAIVADASLGAVPGASLPQIILGADTRFEALATMTLSANRRILLGPVGAAGAVTFGMGTNTLSLPQLIADNTGSTGTLVKTGSGTLTLSNSGNSFSGGTIISNGTLNVAVAGNNTATALGVGRPLTINTGGVLRLTVADAIGYFAGNPGPFTINGGSMTVAGGIHCSVGNFGFILNGGTITSEGPGDATGNYIIDGPITTLSNANPSVISAKKIYVRVNPINYNVAAGGIATDLLVTADVTINGMIKNGDGTMVMTGTNTYAGGTSINGGTLAVDLIADSAESRIGTAGGAANFLALGGGTLRFTGVNTTNTTTRYLWIDQGPGTFDIVDANSALAFSPTGGSVIRGVTKKGAGSLVLNGILGGTGTVTVAGGRLTLNAVNTRTSPTFVTNGTLIVNGSIDTGDVTIASSGTLGGTGTVNGLVTSSGTVAPGTSPGLLTLASYTQNSGGALAIEIGGPAAATGYDQLLVIGTATIGGALNVSLANSYVPTNSDTFTILISGGGLTGTFATTNLPALTTGLIWNVAYAPNNVTLSVTNIPSTGYNAYVQAITNAALRGYQDDPDGDGYANLLEYVTGGDATNSDTIASMDGTRVGGLLALKFTRTSNSVDATIIVEGANTSTNEANWIGIATNIGGSWGSATNVNETGGPAVLNVTAFDTDPATNRFLRLRITRP